jgi:hypothetical protein
MIGAIVLDAETLRPPRGAPAKLGVTMPKLRILSSKGDTVIQWDKQRLERGDPEALAAVREAERIFAAERARGATAFAVLRHALPRRMDHFDPRAEHVVVVPRIAGG